MTNTASTTRKTRTLFGARVSDGDTVVLDKLFPSRWQRRDAVIELLARNHDEVEAREVIEILTPFGGANADVALEEVFELYAKRSSDRLELTLAEHETEDGPAMLYITFTDYGDGNTATEVYTSREQRLEDLRQRAANVYGNLEIPDNASEDELVNIIQTFLLMPTRGRLHLSEARTDAHGEMWRSDLI